MPMNENAPAAVAALLNQIPNTMTVTRDLLAGLFGIALTAHQQGQQANVNPLAFLMQAVVALENRLEQLEGRTGFDQSVLGSLIAEFNLGG